MYVSGFGSCVFHLCTCHCRVVPVAMDRAIKEIVTAIVQRSVTIATQTTKELVLKVFFLRDFNPLAAQ